MTNATTLVLVVGACVLAGCATTGPSSPSARPVFYPNAALDRIGHAAAQRETDQCIASAMAAGLTPEEKSGNVEKGAVRGAAAGGTAAAVNALIHGRGVGRAVVSGAEGAVVGGSVGAVAGSFQDKPNPTYRNYVQRCLKDRGLDVIGWN